MIGRENSVKFIEFSIWEDGSCAAHDIGYANNAEIDKYGELNAKLNLIKSHFTVVASFTFDFLKHFMLKFNMLVKSF